MNARSCGGTRTRRERQGIVMEILELARRGSKKTNLMYKVGLNYSQNEKYLDELKKADFISEQNGIWRTTDRGLQAIEACKICHQIVKLHEKPNRIGRLGYHGTKEEQD